MDPNELQRLLSIFTRGLELSNEELENLNDNFAALRATMRTIPGVMDNIRNSADQTRRATEQGTRATQENIRATRDETTATQQNTNITRALAQANAELETSTKKLKENFLEMGNSLLRVTGQLADTIFDTSTDLKKYNNVIGSAGDAAASLASEFGIFGKVIGLAIKGVTGFAQKQIELVDNTLKNVDSLSKLGARAAFTTDELVNLTQGAGRTQAEFEKLGRPLQSVGRGLLSLGGSASEGAKTFIKDIASVGDRTRNEFRRIGVSFDELTQYQADYMNIVGKSGRVFSDQDIASGKVRKASLDYVITLQTLADITGKSVEEAQKELNATQDTIELAILNNQMLSKEQRLKQSLTEASPAEKAKIQAELDLIQKQKDILGPTGEFSKAMAEAGLTDIAGQLQVALSTGQLKPEVAARMASLGVDMDKFMTQFKKGTLDQGELVKQVFAGAQRRLDQMGGAMLAAGDVKQIAKDLGLTQDQIIRLNAVLGQNVDVSTRAADAEAAKRDAMGKKEDALVETRNEVLEKELNNRIRLEQDMMSNMNLTLEIYKSMPSILNSVYNAFEKLVNILPGLITALAVGKVISFMATLGNAAMFLRRLMRPPRGGGGGGGFVGPPRPPSGPPVGGRGLGAFLRGGAGRLLGGMVPGVGTAMSGMDLISNLSAGNYGGAAMSALNMGIGLIPGGGLLKTGLSLGMGALTGGMGGVGAPQTSDATAGIINLLGESNSFFGKILGQQQDKISDELITSRETQKDTDTKILNRNTESFNVLSRMSTTLNSSNNSLESMKTNGITIAEVKIPESSAATTTSGTAGAGITPAAGGAGGGGLLSTLGSMLRFAGGGVGMAGSIGLNFIGQLLGIGGSPAAGTGQSGAVGLAQSMLGLSETKDKNTIMEYLRRGGIASDPSIEAWCASFVNSTLAQIGMRGTGSKVANSFQNWGQEIPRNDVQAGDVVLETKKLPANKPGGHVGLATGAFTGSTIEMIAGNTKGKVSKYSIPFDDDVVVRRGLPQAATGGILSGPTSGFPAMLHGTEMVVPLNSNSLLAELGKKSSSQIENDMKATAGTMDTQLKDVLNQNQTLISMLADKLDNVINRLDSSNDTQSKLLRYSQA